jgi:uncharacterized protein YciI
MKYVVFYEPADGIGAKVAEQYPAHRKFFEEFHARGDLLMIGPFSDPARGAMAVFTNRSAAEEFVAGDPFVHNGIVRAWRIEEWREAFTG